MRGTRAEALDAIHAAALDPGLWQTALDAVSLASGGVRSHLLHADLQGSVPQRTFVSGYDPDYLKTWDAHYGRINAWAPGFVAGPVGQPRPCEAMCDYDSLRRTEFYADWVRPQDDIVGGGGIVLTRSATQLILFGGQIPRRIRDRLDPQWQQDLALYGQAIRFALETNRALLSLSLDLLLARRGFAAVGDPAVFLLDETGRIVFANASADAMLQSGGQVASDRASRLVLRDEAADAALRRMSGPGRIAAVAVGPPVVLRLPGTGSALRLFRLSEPNAAALRLPPMPPGRRPATVVVISDEQRADETGHSRLAADLGLTPAEAETALRLADGMSTSEIADLRGVSVHTVRNQIKAALQKTGTRRQSDLVALVVRLVR